MPFLCMILRRYFAPLATCRCDEDYDFPMGIPKSSKATEFTKRPDGMHRNSLREETHPIKMKLCVVVFVLATLLSVAFSECPGELKFLAIMGCALEAKEDPKLQAAFGDKDLSNPAFVKATCWVSLKSPPQDF
ncbi:uncharacterized protein LOC135366373 isoform X2 [Ornithodoros turicata]|uniref:uncharacterized protein LOC135366373 isoform X2 n=1 Tax=Ornithodoros turicata TaxID=34597 RepID=UPI003138E8C7